MAVQVESYRSSTPSQYYNCQRIGHSSRLCGYSPRCVKCAGAHIAKDCTKSREEEPTCINCQGCHTANYKKCPSLLATIASRRPLRPNLAQTTSAQATPTPSLSQPQQSNNQANSISNTYASKVSPNTPSSTRPDT